MTKREALNWARKLSHREHEQCIYVVLDDGYHVATEEDMDTFFAGIREDHIVATFIAGDYCAFDFTIPAQAGERGETTMSDTDSGDLVAQLRHDTWTVLDTAGGRWWPNQETAEEIEASDDPEATILRICTVEPMRGEWCD